MADPYNVSGTRDTVGLTKGSPTELAEPYEPVQTRAAVETDPEGATWGKDTESRREAPVLALPCTSLSRTGLPACPSLPATIATPIPARPECPEGLRDLASRQSWLGVALLLHP